MQVGQIRMDLHNPHILDSVKFNIYTEETTFYVANATDL